MQNFINEKIASLPKFDDEITKILSSFDSLVPSDEIVSRIMNIPAIESKILNFAFCRFSPIEGEKTLPNAFKFYGHEGMRALFLFSIFEGMFDLNFECYKTDRARFIEISLKRNLFLSEWIKSYPSITPDILPSVILMDFGRAWISEYIDKEGKNGEFYLHIKNCLFPQDFTDVEMRYTGMSRERVGQILFKHFGLEKIATDVYFSDFIDDSPFESRLRYEMLKVSKTAIGIYHCFDDRSIDNALNLLVEFGLEQEAFLDSKRNFNQ